MSQTNGKKPWQVTKYEVGRTRLMFGGLIAISLIITQDFIASGVFDSSKKAPDVPAFISVVAFAIALPLLSAQLLITFEDGSRLYALDDSLGLKFAYWLGILGALTGIVTAFLHISSPAGIAILVSILISAAFYADYVARLRRLDTTLKTKGTENVIEDEDPYIIEH